MCCAGCTPGCSTDGRTDGGADGGADAAAAAAAARWSGDAGNLSTGGLAWPTSAGTGAKWPANDGADSTRGWRRYDFPGASACDGDDAAAAAATTDDDDAAAGVTPDQSELAKSPCLITSLVFCLPLQQQVVHVHHQGGGYGGPNYGGGGMGAGTGLAAGLAGGYMMSKMLDTDGGGFCGDDGGGGFFGD
eukprot:COSAG02_NODE_7156_length_3150_cov_714.062275_1_plen_190_part_00